MRINNPRLFNGQFLASQNQIAEWLGLNLLSAEGLAGISGQISAALIPIKGIDVVEGKFPIYGTTVKITDAEGAKTIKAYVDDAISGLNIGSYASIQYVNEQDNLHLLSAYAYTDQVSAELKTYIDTQDGATLQSAKDYTDEEITKIQAQVAAVKKYDVAKGKAINVTKTSTDDEAGITTDTFTVAVDYEGLKGDVSGQIASELKVVKLDDVADDAYASQYQLQLNGTALGETINIPKDQILQKGEYIPSSETLQLTFLLADNTTSTVDIPVGDLVDEYSAGNGIEISDSVSGKNVISAKAGKAISVGADGISVIAGNGISVANDKVEVLKSGSSEEFFFVGENGVGVSGIQTAIDEAISAAFDEHDEEWAYTGVAPINVTGTEISLNVGDGLVSGEILKVKKSGSSEDFFFVDASGTGVSGIQDAIDAAVSGANNYADALPYAQIAFWEDEEPSDSIPAEKVSDKDTLYYTANGQTFIVKAGKTEVNDISQEYINAGTAITSGANELTTGNAVYEFVATEAAKKLNVIANGTANNVVFVGENGQVIDSGYSVRTEAIPSGVADAALNNVIPVASVVKAYVDSEVTKAVTGDQVAGILDTKADKIKPVTAGNLAGLNSDGNLTDSGVKVATVINDSDAEVATSKAVKTALDSKVDTSSVISGIVETGADDVSIPTEKAVVDFVKAKTDATVAVVNKKAVEMIEEEVTFGKNTKGSVSGRVIAVYEATGEQAGEQVYPTIKYAAGVSSLSTDVADATYTVIYAKRIGQDNGELPGYQA